MAYAPDNDTDMLELLPEWERSLRARNRAPRTIEEYQLSAQAFAGWMAEQGRSQDITEVRQADIEDYLAAMFDRGLKATTVGRDYRHLRQFFRWAVDDESIERNPMDKMSPPKVPEEPVAIVSDEQRDALLKACEGTGFAERRDMALLRFMLSTGARLSEVAGMRLEDLDMKHDLAVVLGKGRRPRGLTFGARTHEALRKYLKARRSHAKGESDMLWLGRLGPLQGTGIQQIFRRRSAQAGITPFIHPHQLRHTFAHDFMSNGGNETDLMMLAGWNSRTMLDRYGKSAAVERAQANARKLAIDDRY